ncbi:hypothetical protein Taro_039497 [Colocasia esculenta]|uniref:Uncharacterized protein n=1 Tax=Colocasia esculenta TaxID=4460 RepID=A0A843WVX9_COLES|nr:hypothetical protein [Colocasia esculenta]
MADVPLHEEVMRLIKATPSLEFEPFCTLAPVSGLKCGGGTPRTTAGELWELLAPLHLQRLPPLLLYLSIASPKLSTGACLPELQVSGLCGSVDRSLVAVDSYLSTASPKLSTSACLPELQVIQLGMTLMGLSAEWSDRDKQSQLVSIFV